MSFQTALMESGRLCQASVIAVVAFAACLASTGRVYAQTSLLDTRIRIGEEDASDFSRAMTSLARQAHVSISVEGTPLSQTLTKDQIPSLSDLASPTRFGNAIARIGEAYGYTVTKAGSSFSLSKRYDDPKDLPDISLEETIVSMHDVVQILTAFNPKIENSRVLVGDVFLALTPEQIQELPKHTLHVTDLNRQAHEFAKEAATFIYIGPNLTGATELYYRLAHSQRARLRLAQQTAPQRIGMAATGGLFIHFDGETADRQIGRAAIGHGDPAGEAIADARDVSDLINEIGATGAKRGGALTLESACAALTAKGGVRLSASPELMSRSVQVFGVDNAAPESTFRALAYACGLAIRSEANGKDFTIVRPRLRIPEDIGGVSIAIRRALPDTFLRACAVERVYTSDRFSAVAALADDTTAPVAGATAPHALIPQSPMGKDWLLQIAAAHRLKAVLEIRKRQRQLASAARVSSADAAVLVGDLDYASRSALGGLFLAEFVGRAESQLPLKPVAYLVDFEQDILGGGIRFDIKGAPKLDLEFLMPTADGKGITFNAAIGDAKPPASLSIPGLGQASNDVR